jgi:excisionase family DNA binding protein
MKQTMSRPEAARALGIGLNYLYSLLLAGRLPGTKVDGKWQIDVQDIRARIAALEKEAVRG